MGQYYRAAVMDIKTSAPIKIFESYDYDHNGAKLTEHSYIGNEYVEAVLEFIADNGPARIMWCGDYANAYVEAEKFPNADWALSKKNLRDKVKFMDNIWSDEAIMAEGAEKYPTIVNVNPFNQSKPFYRRIKYIHNITKDVWIDLQDYWITGKLDFNPIPLLTAIGNGYGGGDYGGTNEDCCGSWAGDVFMCFYDDDILHIPLDMATGKPRVIHFTDGTEILKPNFIKLQFEES